MSITDKLYHYRFRVDRVIDGDTIVGKLDKGRNNFDEDVKIRLLGIQAPEITRAKTMEEKARGYTSKAFLKDLILNKWVVAQTHKMDNDDSFGRMLGDIYLPLKDYDLHINQYMIEHGHAEPYKK